MAPPIKQHSADDIAAAIRKQARWAAAYAGKGKAKVNKQEKLLLKIAREVEEAGE